MVRKTREGKKGGGGINWTGERKLLNHKKKDVRGRISYALAVVFILTHTHTHTYIPTPA